MKRDLLELYAQASEWTLGKVAGAANHPGATTPCDGWDVRTLMNHMLETQQYFVGSARGEGATPPSPTPPDLLGADPVAEFQRARDETLQVFSEDDVLEKTGPTLGIAMCDQLLHGWDLAKATGQDTTMPAGLPEVAFEMMDGRLTDEQRQGTFKPAVSVGAEATAQDRLLAYTGRDPAG